MSRLNLYEYNSYRKYLKDRLESLGPKSGLKRRAAEALGVHTTFISQVVLEKAELSLDQAERMNDFLGHVEEEGEFFLDLVIYERAGEPALKKRYGERLKRRQTERTQIKRRLENVRELRAEDQATFYSSHLYGLLHVLASIPRYRQRKALAAATGFPPEVTEDAIDFLLRIGVLKAVKDQILPGEQHVHLGRDSRHIRQHHTNWRLATVQHLGFADPTDLHYSLTFTCSEQTAVKIRESLLEHLKSLAKTIESSKEEHAFVYCFDLFKWT